jgi:hypothetical protein
LLERVRIVSEQTEVSIFDVFGLFGVDIVHLQIFDFDFLDFELLCAQPSSEDVLGHSAPLGADPDRSESLDLFLFE